MSEGVKIHPALPLSLYNRMQERVAERDITTTAFVIDAIRKALRDEKET